MVVNISERHPEEQKTRGGKINIIQEKNLTFNPKFKLWSKYE